ncbi:MAG: hypothetical protein AAFO04_17665 [Cyanobacteria bacterium J06592_8]
MSILHWDRAILSLHLREILEDETANNQTALTGIGLLVLGTIVLPATAKYARPLLKAAIKQGIFTAQETQKFWQDVKVGDVISGKK